MLNGHRHWPKLKSQFIEQVPIQISRNFPSSKSRFFFFYNSNHLIGKAGLKFTFKQDWNSFQDCEHFGFYIFRKTRPCLSTLFDKTVCQDHVKTNLIHRIKTMFSYIIWLNSEWEQLRYIQDCVPWVQSKSKKICL